MNLGLPLELNLFCTPDRPCASFDRLDNLYVMQFYFSGDVSIAV